MRLARSEPFVKEYLNLQLPIRKKLDRQLTYLAENLRHPGLYAKKVSGAADIWEARIDYHFRFTFQILENVILLRRAGTHDILKNP